jgi:hypothetical protein
LHAVLRHSDRCRLCCFLKSDADEGVFFPAVDVFEVAVEDFGAVGPSAVAADADQVVSGFAGGGGEAAAEGVAGVAGWFGLENVRGYGVESGPLGWCPATWCSRSCW